MSIVGNAWRALDTLINGSDGIKIWRRYEGVADRKKTGQGNIGNRRLVVFFFFLFFLLFLYSYSF